MREIVVGIDGSEDSHRALDWAVTEAKLRKVPLRIVHSWTFPSASKGTDDLPHADFESAAEKVLEEALGAISDPGGITIEREIANDEAGDALVRLSEAAEMVVVGSRGLGGLKGLVLGSVTQHVTREARCPVVIVPHVKD